MKPYSVDLREKVVNAYERGDSSVRKVAAQFGVAKSFVQKLLQLKRTQSHLNPKKQGGAMRGQLDEYGRELLLRQSNRMRLTKQHKQSMDA